MKTRLAFGLLLAMFLLLPLGCKKDTPASSGGSAGSSGGSGTVTVYVTRSGTKYHRDGCRYLSKSKIPMPLEEAKKRYGPCSVCNPPE